jgi:alpha-tubulin suppressor-like RCC1 family protein
MGQRRKHSAIGRAVTVVTLASTGVVGVAVPHVTAEMFAPPADGTVISWGLDVEGQLGDGDRPNVDSPSEVPGLFATSIEAGNTFSFAVDPAGAVLGWGRDGADAALGNGVGFSNDMSSPIGFGAVRVESGFFHTLASKADGSAWVWGVDMDGALGNGPGASWLYAPMELTLPGGATVVDFDAGGLHSLVVTTDGAAYAFGRGDDGQLGLANGFVDAESPTPVAMPEGVGVVDVDAGWYHSLAIGTDGQLYAWGDGGRGRLGTGGLGSSDVPKVVSLAPGVLPVAISAGGEFSLAIGDDGLLYSWGSDDFGVLGNGPGGASAVPQPAALPEAVAPVAISAGGYHSLMLGADGAVYAWGADLDEQIGDGAGAVTVESMVPVAVGPFTAVSAGFNHSLALAGDGQVWAWGGNAFAQTGVAPSSGAVVTQLPSGAEVSSLAAGLEHTLAIADDVLWAWGSDDYGKLGNGAIGSVGAPEAIELPPGVTPREVSAAWLSSLMIAADGTVFTWGLDQEGQLGNGPGSDNVGEPTAIELAPGVRGVTAASGGEHHLVIGDDGKLYAFGLDRFGQLGDGPTGDGGWAESPVLVDLPPSVSPVMIAAGRAFSLAVGDNGVLYGWGNNQFAQLGQGSAGGNRSEPTVISLPAGFVPVQLVAGGAHAFVVGADGSLYAWGRDDFGQVGNGTANDGSLVVSPTALTLPSGVRPVSVAGGRVHSVMLGSDGQVYGWGRRTEGQLGNRAVITSSLSSPTVLPLGVPVSSAVAVVAGPYHNLVVTGSTPRTVPQAPGAPTATLTGASTAAVSFGAPAGDGGWPVRWYRATCVSSNGGAAHAVLGVTSPIAVSGLTSNRAYTCSVEAINALGASAASPPTNQIVTATVPGAPTGLVAVVGNGQVSLTWSPPTSDGGSPITDYLVFRSSNGGVSYSEVADGVSLLPSAVVTGLRGGTTYRFRIRAVNAVGNSNYSSMIDATPTAVPSAPLSLSGVPGSGSVALSWSAPVSNGGAPITDYLVYRSSNGGASYALVSDPVSASTTANVAGLASWVSYRFRVQAVNSQGMGNFSSTIDVTALDSAPSAPLGLTAVPGAQRVALSWSPPANNGGAPVTDYRVFRSSNGGVWYSLVNDAVSTSTSFTVTGLANGVNYRFRIRAVNAIGQGNYSNVVSATPS